MQTAFVIPVAFYNWHVWVAAGSLVAALQQRGATMTICGVRALKTFD
jgi:hypothetical protein